ncbi:MAG: cell division protein SepF [Clostridiales Family XIII bacterium]|jgi:cell division inhibitor SepF|nr:cell division protein SepF [Clostridiales Family XIII bacterium]
MAFLDKIKTLVGVEDDEFAENYLDEEPIQPKPQSIYGLGERNQTIGRDRPAWTPPARSNKPSTLYNDTPVRSIRKERDNVVGQSAGSTLRALTQKFKIVVVEPKHFEDRTKLVDNLKSRKPVIINFEKVETDTARKIFEFLCGATYALSGNVQKIANNIFVFLPENVDVTTNAEQEGSSFGMSDSPWQR